MHIRARRFIIDNSTHALPVQQQAQQTLMEISNEDVFVLQDASQIIFNGHIATMNIQNPQVANYKHIQSKTNFHCRNKSSQMWNKYLNSDIELNRNAYNSYWSNHVALGRIKTAVVKAGRKIQIRNRSMIEVKPLSPCKFYVVDQRKEPQMYRVMTSPQNPKLVRCQRLFHNRKNSMHLSRDHEIQINPSFSVVQAKKTITEEGRWLNPNKNMLNSNFAHILRKRVTQAKLRRRAAS